MKNETLEFLASIPNIKSAIVIGGDCASQLKLEIPETEIAKAISLVKYTERILKITVEIYEEPMTN